MTQTALDIANASEPVLRRLLAEWLCDPRNVSCDHGEEVMDRGTRVGAHKNCQGTGLAFPWASSSCSNGLGCLACVPKPEPLVHDALIYARGRICNGSGRVPKEFGLEVLFEHAPSLGDFEDIIHVLIDEHIRTINEGGPADYILAALRAFAQAAMR